MPLYHYDAIWDSEGLVFLDIPVGAAPGYDREDTIIKADASLRTYLGRLKTSGETIPKPEEHKWLTRYVSFPVDIDNIKPLDWHEFYPKDPHAEYSWIDNEEDSL